jgi:hypothetical protein
MNAKRIHGLKTVPLLVAVAVLAVAGSAVAQEYITEVTIITGSAATPEGYTKLPTDLNKKTFWGGDRIYLCYKKSVGAPVTKIYVTTGKSRRHPNVPEKCTLINVDLNRGAGGDYIYLWTTHDPMCDPISDIIIIEGKSTKTPAGYTKIGKDLNDNAGGAYLYFAYMKEPVPN